MNDAGDKINDKGRGLRQQARPVGPAERAKCKLSTPTKQMLNFEASSLTYLDSSFATGQATCFGASLDLFLVAPTRQHLVGISRQWIGHLRIRTHAGWRNAGRVAGHVLSHRRHILHIGGHRRANGCLGHLTGLSLDVVVRVGIHAGESPTGIVVHIV